MDDLIDLDPSLLSKWNISVPRYTSYPTSPQFVSIEESIVRQKLTQWDQSQKPLSVYVHIPFCKTMCLFCGCSVILNRSSERQASYLHSLLQEIRLTAQTFSSKKAVQQLHLGGGTPTSLTEEELERLMVLFHACFSFGKEREISIEIDPRTVYEDKGRKLAFLKQLGFNRVSFGVQDLDPKVQEAVRRRQSEAVTRETYEKARNLGFQGINIDLIYGLPYQTRTSFAKTVQTLLTWKPDRIALYSYAKIPWLKAHQKAIPEKTLPSTEEKFKIYVEARKRLMEGGYVAIGMDHFALKGDALSKAYYEKQLTRNFQGYSVQLAEDIVGFGVSSISFVENCYWQNQKELKVYHDLIAQKRMPVERGIILSEEDLKRRFIIQSLMCHFELDKDLFRNRFGVDFSFEKKDWLEGFIEETETKLLATPKGRLFIRLVASSFDAYLNKGQFSRAI